MEMSIVEQLALIAQESRNEVQTVLMVVCLVLCIPMVAALLLYKTRNIASFLLGKFRKLGPVGMIVISAFVCKMWVYGSTKQIVRVEHFTASECPDSVTFTWDEIVPNSSDVTIAWVQVQRRLLGVTEEEGWGNYGSPVPGGVGAITVDGFTLDKDYEYRVIYAGIGER